MSSVTHEFPSSRLLRGCGRLAVISLAIGLCACGPAKHESGNEGARGSGNESTATPAIAEANRWLEQDDYGQALAVVDRILAKEPKNLEALSLRGGICHHFGRYRQAVAHYDKILAIVPGNADASENRANSVAAQRGIFGGEFTAPRGDLPAVASEAPKRGEWKEFFGGADSAQVLDYEKVQKFGQSKEVERTWIKAIPVRVPMTPGHAPLTVYLPLSDAEFHDESHTEVKLSFGPGRFIFVSHLVDPQGQDYCANYLEWLWHKS